MSHPAVFASNVQCVRLAAGRRTLKKLSSRLISTPHIQVEKSLQKSSCFQLLILRHWHFTR